MPWHSFRSVTTGFSSLAWPLLGGEKNATCPLVRAMTTKREIELAIKGHVLANAELIGTYQKRDR